MPWPLPSPSLLKLEEKGTPSLGEKTGEWSQGNTMFEPMTSNSRVFFAVGKNYSLALIPLLGLELQLSHVNQPRGDIEKSLHSTLLEAHRLLSHIHKHTSAR